VLGGSRDQTSWGDNRWRQLSHAWSSVSARVCTGNADFDELTVKRVCPSFGLEIIILCGGFAHSYKATLNTEVLIWSCRCLDETELREFVLKKFKRQRRLPIISSNIFCEGLRTTPRGQPSLCSQRATDVPDRRNPIREAK